MKIRSLAVAPLLAAAMLGTTAAAWPSSPAAMPQAPPALTATALSARYAVTKAAVTKAEATATRAGDRQLARALARLRTRQVLFFKPRPWPPRRTASTRGSGWRSSPGSATPPRPCSARPS